MTYQVRHGSAVREWMQAQHAAGTTGWKGMCQSSARQAMGVPAWAPSAILAWQKIPAHHKHAGGDPGDAPEGAILYYAIGKYGHAAVAGKHREWCWSVDYEVQDRIGRAPRDFRRWGGITYLGWSTWVPYE